MIYGIDRRAREDLVPSQGHPGNIATPCLARQEAFALGGRTGLDMHPVVLIGSGGHAREVAEIAEHAHREGLGGPLLGYLDEDPTRHGLDVLGFPVLGSLDWLESRMTEVDLVIAIGDDEVRRRLVGQLGPRASYATLVSPLAHLSRHCTIGEGTVIFPRAVVSNQVTIGRHVILGTASSVSHDGKVGDYCSLFPGALMTGGVCLGDHVMLGANSSVIPGKTIGSGSKVGAGACVVADLPSNITAVGVPARPR